MSALRRLALPVSVFAALLALLAIAIPASATSGVATNPATALSGTKATLNGEVNPDGAELSECKFEYGETTEYGQIVPCAESTATIGSGTSPVAVHADIAGLHPNGAEYDFRLVVEDATNTIFDGENQSFNTADTVITEAPSGITPTAGTMNGSVNPDGVAITECVFEWGETTAYGETASCVPSAAGIGSGTSPVAVHADLSGLTIGGTYHYRLKVADANGPIHGHDELLVTAGPGLGASWSEDVVITEAVLKAQINPNDAATTFHFEYGKTASYGSSTAESGAGSDSSVHEVSSPLEGLQSGTTYHYRVVATDGTTENLGPDHTFTTYEPFVPNTNCPNQVFRYGPSVNLPDCRAYEMVTPLDKNGGEVPSSASQGTIVAYPSQISLNGDRVSFGSITAFAGAKSAPAISDYIAHRTPTGWQTEAISPPRSGESNLTIIRRELATYKVFSPDLSVGWLLYDYDPPLDPAAPTGFADLYRHEIGGSVYEALNTNVPVGGESSFPMELQGLSADGSHVVFSARTALLPEAPSAAGGKLYEYTAGELHLVSVLPNGEPAVKANLGTLNGAGFSIGRGDSLERAISDDGSHIFWTDSDGGAGHTFDGEGHLFVRIDGQTTVPVSQSVSDDPSAHFWGASRDGSKVLFTVGPGADSKLYEFDVDTETPTLIAGKVDAFNSSNVRVGGVLGASDDLSYIYFVSLEALVPGAVAGENNLYLDHGGDFTFIGALSSSDATTTETANAVSKEPFRHLSRVTSDGHRLAFTSNAGLTGYDNADRVTDAPATEAYVYNADADRLICVSCNPSGERPESRPLEGAPGVIFGRAAFVPGAETDLYASRPLSADGRRLIFDSYDALVPRDTNGHEDVYEWEEAGAGKCEESSPEFSQRNDGCVSLISSGKSDRDEEFQDATPSGSVIAFNTAASIDPEDPGAKDIYVASEDGGFPPPPPPTPPCVGDSCQSVPSAPNDPTPASAGFKGAGDPQPAKKARPRCRRRARHVGRSTKKHKAAKGCRRAKRGAGR